jgi:cell division protein FtsA
MGQNQYIVALEIGSSKIVGAIGEKTSVGVEVSHLEEEKLINCVRYGCIQNVENTKSCVNRILKKLENRIDGTIKEVYLGVSGRSLHSETCEVTRALDASKSITNEVINDIISDAHHGSFNNYDIIDIVPRTFFVDKNETKNPSGQFGSSIDIKLNQIVAKPTIKLNLDRVMSIGVKVKNYLVTPLVVGQEILTDSELSLGCMLVDAGAETTTVSIYKDNALVYLITLPLGGRNITHDIVTGLNVLEESAERVKKNINNPLDPNVESVNIEEVNSSDAANYIAARTGEIMANINQQLAYAGMSYTDIHNIVLIGGAAQMQGFAQKLEETTKIKVRMGSYPDSVNILDHSINRPEFIQIFSLLAKSADLIGDGESCIERSNYNDLKVNGVQQQYEATPRTEPVKEQPKQHVIVKHKFSAWDKMKEKLGRLLDENDDEEDEDN